MVAPAAATAGPVWVSGPSPFGDCPPAGLDDLLPQGAVEPAVAVNPFRPDRITAVWTQDRFRGLMAGISSDGGRSWQRVVIPGTSRCTGGAFDYVDDVWLSAGPTGAVHLSAHVFDAPETTPSGLVVARSLDGGRTWSRPVVVVEEHDPDGGTYVGGAITADPRNPALVYAVVPKIIEPRQEGEPFRAAVVFAASGDAGRTWRPRQIFDPGDNHVTTGHQIVVLADGTLVDSFTLFDLTGAQLIKHAAVIRSQDGGVTWSQPTIVAEMISTGAHDPQRPQDQVSSASVFITDAAVDPATGRMYMIWQDSRFTDGQADAIALSVSDDGARSWSAPVKANRTPTNIPIGNQQAFTASVAVTGNGTVAVDYFDLRHNTDAADLPTDRWLVSCQPSRMAGCLAGQGFTTETRLTLQPFDMRQAPLLTDIGPPGFFLGDYQALAATGRTGFIALFAQPDGMASPRIAGCASSIL